MGYEAKVIADSICNGHRLTTMQLTYPRIIHSEFMTHCMFARNASSSRAIPFNVTVQRVIDDPFVPEEFGTNQKGMQAAIPLEGIKLRRAVELWLKARDLAIQIARELADPDCTACHGLGTYIIDSRVHVCYRCGGDGKGLNVHKSLVNRLIEPWSYITCCVTGDDGAWSNYFALRCEKDADKVIQKQAYMAQLAYYKSEPAQLSFGQWHLPYITKMDEHALTVGYDVIEVSVGRCARTSYLTQEGKHDYAEDINLHNRLKDHKPLHASPFEHVCQAMNNDEHYGKYIGWCAYRHMLPGEYVVDFAPNHPELINGK